MPPSLKSSSQKKRCSSRLKDREVAASKASAASHAQSSSASRTKRRRISDVSALMINDRGCDEESTSTVKQTPAVSASKVGRLRRTTTTELEQRENRLLHREQDLNDQLKELDERLLSLSRKEDQTFLMMSQLAERDAQATLNHLEEYFTCALCYEILASPYSLNPAHCGHTFCGLCILKWFFSRLHRVCGLWHESVDCPICRSVLLSTPEHTPRSQTTFPFVPNRVTASAIESLVEKLVKAPLCSQAKIKREDSEGTWTSQSRKNRGRGCGRKREPSEGTETEKISDTVDVIPWREGGHLRAEWLRKDREGKKEMSNILKYWSTMGSQDFIRMKQKLCV